MKQLEEIAVVFFEAIAGGLVRRMHRETLTMKQELLSIAEILQTIGGVAIPEDPEMTTAQNRAPHGKTIRVLACCAI